MERTLSPDERIRRAEEIYYRRRIKNTNKKSARVNISQKKDFGMFKKMILQIVVCILIYFGFYIIQNNNYIFSEDVIKKTNEVLSYDINIEYLYKQCVQYFNNLMNSLGVSIRKPQNENIVETDTNNENIVNEEANIEKENAPKEENIGGENVTDEKKEPLSQMEKDAKYILENKSLVIPLKGTITSRYGLRNPKTPTVPKNHTGIDIAVNEGTVFIASMSGNVKEISSKRRSWKSYKNCK